MSNEVIFKNDLVSLEYDDIRFGLFDSDGNYIDYLFYVSEVEHLAILTKNYIEQIRCLNEKQVTEWIKNTFDILKLVPDCSPVDIAELRGQWGNEWVCRVGNTALILYD